MKNFGKALGIRALRTFCQTALSLIPVGVTVQEVSWLMVLSTALLSAIVSALMSVVTGLPEVEGAE